MVGPVLHSVPDPMMFFLSGPPGRDGFGGPLVGRRKEETTRTLEKSYGIVDLVETEAERYLSPPMACARRRGGQEAARHPPPLRPWDCCARRCPCSKWTGARL